MTSVNGNISQRKDDYDGMPEEVQIEEFLKKTNRNIREKKRLNARKQRQDQMG